MADEDIISKTDWYETEADSSQHKLANETQRLTEKYAAKGKDFTKTEQYRSMQDYLEGVPDTRGGGLGAIRENDPVLSAGSEAAQLARENLLYQADGKRRGNLTAEDIKGINIDLVREGMTPDDYFRFNQMLYSPNIEEYQKARPISSGKSLRDIITMATPAKYIKRAAETIGRTVLDAPSDFMDSAMVEGITNTWKGRKKGEGFKGLINNVLQMTGIGNTDQAKKFTNDKVTENIQIDETDQGENIDVSLATIKEANKNKTEELSLASLQDKKPTSLDIQGVQNYITDVSKGIQVAAPPDNMKETWDFMVTNNIPNTSEYLVGSDIINQSSINPNAVINTGATINPNTIAPVNADPTLTAAMTANPNFNFNFTTPKLNYDLINQKQALPLENANYPGVL